MKIRELFKNYLDTELTVNDFTMDSKGRVNLTFKECPIGIILPTALTDLSVKQTIPSTTVVTPKTTSAPKRKADKDELSTEDLDAYITKKKLSMGVVTDSGEVIKVDPAKKVRRIKCPLTGELISSEQYHANKKAGMYIKH